MKTTTTPPTSSTVPPNDPVFVRPLMKIVPASEPVTGRVVENSLCSYGKSASFVRHFAVDVSGTPLAGTFVPGQAFGVVPPGVDANGRPHAVRLYSVSSPSWGEDGQGNVIATSVKRLIEERKPQRSDDDPEDHRLFIGVCSNYMCDLRVGDEVKVTGPSGKRFVMPQDTELHDYLFIATGTGIAPFRSMALELLRRKSGPTKSQVHLVSGFPYTGDLIYHRQFMQLAEEHENFHYHTVISREGKNGRGRYCDQYIADEIETFAPVLESPRTLVYICGIAGMEVGFYKVLANHGVADAYVRVAQKLAAMPVKEWSSEDVKRDIRPGARCLVEVY